MEAEAEVGERTKKEFGRRLRTHRKRAGLSTDELARKLKIHRNTVYHLEAGEQWIGADLLERICEAIKIDPGLLFSDNALVIKPTPLEALKIIETALQSGAVLARIPSALLDRLAHADQAQLDAIASALSADDPSEKVHLSAPKQTKKTK